MLKLMTLPIQRMVLAVIMIVITSFCISIFTPVFAQNLSNDVNVDSSNTPDTNLQKLIIDAKGPIASIQNDDNGTWIVWGNWELINNASVAVPSSSPLSFNASITKVRTDNTEDHKYKIYNFNSDSSNVKTVGSSSVLVFNGTGTISTDGGEYAQVPINIGIIDGAPVTASIDMGSGAITPSWVPKGGTISILIAAEGFPDNFGNSPIYGIVKKGKGA